MAGLDEILNPAAEEAEVEQEVPETETQEEPAAETGVAETQVAAESQEEAKEDPAAAVKAELAALTKERQRLREKEQALDAARAQREEAAKAKPDFWEDPEGQLSAVEQRMEHKLQQQRLGLSEMYARDKHTDYQEKLDAFVEMVKEDPSLYNRMLQQENPAEFAYRTATSNQKLKEMGDPVEYEQKLRASIEAEIRGKIEAEAAAKETAKVEAAIKAKLSKSGFSEQRSVGNNSRQKSYDGPTPLGSILK